MSAREESIWWLRTAESDLEAARTFADRLVACLSERIVVDALVLFGSRATGDAFDESDWDFAVVSRDFRGLDPLARGHLVLECRLPGIDLVHLIPEELLEPGRSYLCCAVLEEGEPVIDRGVFAAAQRAFEERKAAGEIVVRGPVVEFR